MRDEKIILQGGGEHARVVLDCLLASKKNVLGLFDPKYTGNLFGVAQLGNYDPEYEPHALAVIAIGDNDLRKKVASFTRHTFTNAIHPSAIISPYASIGTGNMILHGAIIQAQSKLGNHIIVNTRAQIDHDCIVSDFVHIGPGAILCGAVRIGEGSFVGAGAVIIPGRKIGSNVTIGAGAVVVTDIDNHVMVAGNPARIIKSRKP
jgi:sugar O-acyltransferase (sialic acid O-acetyltransferase NeuD family)